MMCIAHHDLNKPDFVWHVGSPSPHHQVKLDEVAFVQVDGNELIHVQRMFPMLDMRKNVQRWPNPWASLIIMNL
jgi:hypothetical protein